MGLAGPKQKQRISIDPQNKTWADDTQKVGYKLLQKMGWDSSKGLGINEDGNKAHIAVKFKSDLSGIGSVKKNIDNWIQNSASYDELLRNLNQEVNASHHLLNASHHLLNPSSMTESPSFPHSTSTSTPIALNVIVKEVNEPVLHGRLYHRQKFIRNKQVSNYDSKDLDSIFGVKSLPTNSSGNLSAKKGTQESPMIVHQQISVNDYFAEKLKAKTIQTHLGYLNAKIDLVNGQEGIHDEENSSKHLSSRKRDMLSDEISDKRLSSRNGDMPSGDKSDEDEAKVCFQLVKVNKDKKFKK